MMFLVVKEINSSFFLQVGTEVRDNSRILDEFHQFWLETMPEIEVQ